MSGLLAGRRILITGAARGIGLAFAEAALAQGARVALADVDGDLVQRETERLAASDSPAVGLALDVCDQSSITAAAAEIDGRWGGLDALVNNAAVSDLNPFQEISLERWQQVLAVNLSSVLQVGQGMLDLLRRGRSAAIVNTVSTQAFFGQPRSVAYATAKGGLLNLTRCMAVDLGAEGIRVNAVAPGFIDTRMALTPDGGHEHRSQAFQDHYIDAGRIPLRRAGRSEDCAGAFVFLVSELSLYITGQVIAVDGGLTATY